MHMADALIVPVVAGTMYLGSAAAAGYAVKKVNIDENPQQIPIMGVMGAFVFSAQMINFTIPGTGASGHLCGGFLLAALLGPYAGYLTMLGVLLIQCLMFADGGILALGSNVWNMAFYGCILGALLIWKPIVKNGLTKKKIITASLIGSVLSLQLGAFSVVLQTSLSDITELPFLTFLTFMQPIHLVIGIIEGVITASILCFMYEARPAVFWGVSGREDTKQSRMSLKKMLVVLSAAVVLIGGGLSLAASSNPDGLEWSIEKITGKTELETQEHAIYEQTKNVQEKTAVLSDYAPRNVDEPVGTSFAGIAGGVVVMVFCVCCCLLIRLFVKKAGG